jgi:hypothetical protein
MSNYNGVSAGFIELAVRVECECDLRSTQLLDWHRLQDKQCGIT